MTLTFSTGCTLGESTFRRSCRLTQCVHGSPVSRHVRLCSSPFGAHVATTWPPTPHKLDRGTVWEGILSAGWRGLPVSDWPRTGILIVRMWMSCACRCNCQHGPSECDLNILMNCAMEKMIYPKDYVPVLGCIQGSDDLEQAFQRCLTNATPADRDW